MISYYELLGMIKNKTNPKKVKFDNDIYIWNNVNYECKYFSSYLCSHFNEAEMFEKNIEIVEEDKNIKEIEQIITSRGSYTNFDDVYKDMTKIYEKNDEIVIILNKIIKEVNKLRKDK